MSDGVIDVVWKQIDLGSYRDSDWSIGLFVRLFEQWRVCA